MASWSVPIRPGWKLRVLSGSSLGQEFDLPAHRYVLGSQASADIRIPAAGVAPRHVVIDLHPDHVSVSDCSGGQGMMVNGQRVASARLGPGDQVTVGTFSFQFTNPGVVPAPPTTPSGQAFHRFLHWPLFVRVGVISLAIAVVLYLLLVATRAPTLVPVTLLAMSAVVPATLMCYLVEKYDQTGISFHTLAITFLAGGTVGIISAVLGFVVGGALTGGLLVLPVFAGLWEEPAKLLGTAWRWRHPKYDRPIDGLILGTVSGFGFAVLETAGYGFTALATHGLEGMLTILVLRGLTSPFGHGLWSGLVAAAFWQCNRDPRRAVRSRIFGIALLWAVGLHALWNLGAVLSGLGWGLVIASAVLSVRQYRELLARKGYRP